MYSFGDVLNAGRDLINRFAPSTNQASSLDQPNRASKITQNFWDSGATLFSNALLGTTAALALASRVGRQHSSNPLITTAALSQLPGIMGESTFYSTHRTPGYDYNYGTRVTVDANDTILSTGQVFGSSDPFCLATTYITLPNGTLIAADTINTGTCTASNAILTLPNGDTIETGHGWNGSGFFLTRKTREGVEIWSKEWGGTGNELTGNFGGYGLAIIDTDIVVTGLSESDKVVLLRVQQSNGALVWRTSTSLTESPFGTFAKDVTINSQGNISVTGVTYKSVSGIMDPDALLLNYWPNGTLESAQFFGGVNWESGNAIATTPDKLWIVGTIYFTDGNFTAFLLELAPTPAWTQVQTTIFNVGLGSEGYAVTPTFDDLSVILGGSIFYENTTSGLLSSFATNSTNQWSRELTGSDHVQFQGLARSSTGIVGTGVIDTTRSWTNSSHLLIHLRHNGTMVDCPHLLDISGNTSSIQLNVTTPTPVDHNVSHVPYGDLNTTIASFTPTTADRCPAPSLSPRQNRSILINATIVEEKPDPKVKQHLL